MDPVNSQSTAIRTSASGSRDTDTDDNASISVSRPGVRHIPENESVTGLCPAPTVETLMTDRRISVSARLPSENRADSELFEPLSPTPDFIEPDQADTEASDSAGNYSTAELLTGLTEGYYFIKQKLENAEQALMNNETICMELTHEKARFEENEKAYTKELKKQSDELSQLKKHLEFQEKINAAQTRSYDKAVAECKEKNQTLMRNNAKLLAQQPALKKTMQAKLQQHADLLMVENELKTKLRESEEKLKLSQTFIQSMVETLTDDPGIRKSLCDLQNDLNMDYLPNLQALIARTRQPADSGHSIPLCSVTTQTDAVPSSPVQGGAAQTGNLPDAFELTTTPAEIEITTDTGTSAVIPPASESGDKQPPCPDNPGDFSATPVVQGRAAQTGNLPDAFELTTTLPEIEITTDTRTPTVTLPASESGDKQPPCPDNPDDLFIPSDIEDPAVTVGTPQYMEDTITPAPVHSPETPTVQTLSLASQIPTPSHQEEPSQPASLIVTLPLPLPTPVTEPTPAPVTASATPMPTTSGQDSGSSSHPPVFTEKELNLLQSKASESEFQEVFEKYTTTEGHQITGFEQQGYQRIWQEAVSFQQFTVYKALISCMLLPRPEARRKLEKLSSASGSQAVHSKETRALKLWAHKNKHHHNALDWLKKIATALQHDPDNKIALLVSHWTRQTIATAIRNKLGAETLNTYLANEERFDGLTLDQHDDAEQAPPSPKRRRIDDGQLREILKRKPVHGLPFSIL